MKPRPSLSTLPAALAAALLGGAAHGQPPKDQQPAPPKAAAPGAAGEAEPTDRAAEQPETEDLRTLHWLFALGGSVLTPTSNLVPRAQLGKPEVGGALHGFLGLGLSRHAVLQIDGGAAMFFDTGSLCEDCGATTFDVGAAMVFHLTQGLAFDPWISYGLAYRHSIVSLPDDETSYHAFDFARIALGGDFYPTPSLGFGPYLETDVGFRQDGGALFYGLFQAGVRLSFDPLQSGAQLTPISVAQAR